MNGGIVGNAEKFWEDFLVDLFGEGLSFIFIALAVAFEAMAEYFVEEDGGGASAKQAGPS